MRTDTRAQTAARFRARKGKLTQHLKFMSKDKQQLEFDFVNHLPRPPLLQIMDGVIYPHCNGTGYDRQAEEDIRSCGTGIIEADGVAK